MLTKPVDVAFGTLLKACREDSGQSIRALAAAAGMSKSKILRMEGGENAPPAGDDLAALVLALELDDETFELFEKVAILDRLEYLEPDALAAMRAWCADTPTLETP